MCACIYMTKALEVKLYLKFSFPISNNLRKYIQHIEILKYEISLQS